MSGTRWVALGLVAAFLAVVGYFVVAAIALDDGSGDVSGSSALRVDVTGEAVAPFVGLTEARLSLGGDCLHLVVADALDERVAGLLGREETAPYDGMLFVFDAPTTTRFTMVGVSVPLDIAFYDGAGHPVSRTSMRPCVKAQSECPAYVADGRFVFALETEPGGLGGGALSQCPS